MEKESNLIPRSILTCYIIRLTPKNRDNEIGTNGAGIDKN
jgi:hypothetical protein